jgi:hypothetical protein
MRLKCSPKGERPRYAHIPTNPTRSRSLRAADEADECRLARTIASENPDILSAFEAKIHVIKYPVHPGPSRVDLRNMFE